MKRMYAVTFVDHRYQVIGRTTEFATWQAAYGFARRALPGFPSREHDPIVTAVVIGFMADGRFGLVAEFSIPDAGGAVVRR